jgi:hypothetical protein
VGDIKYTSIVSVLNPKGKSPFGIARRRRQDNFKMDLKHV